MKRCDEILRRTLALTEAMWEIADEGDSAREDVSCGVLYGVLRDSAYKIRKLAEEEREAHIRKGWWREVTVVNVNEFDKKGVDPQEFDAVVLGAATYHGEMIQTMKTFLFSLEKYNLEGKVGGAFGAYGWSGEAPGRIYDTLKNIYKMDMVAGPLMLKNPSLGGGIQMAQDYGKEIAKKLGM